MYDPVHWFTMGARATALLAPVALGACFDPALPEVACGARGQCPPDLVCDFDNVCRPDVTGSPVSDASFAAADADPVLPDAEPNSPDADPSACASNPSYGAPLGDSTYRIIDQNHSWNDARAACEADGADLCVIEGSEEDDHLTPLFVFGSEEAWIGLRYEGDSLVWVDGSAPTYTNFDGAPAPPGCVFKRQSVIAQGKWFVAACGQTRKVICECR